MNDNKKATIKPCSRLPEANHKVTERQMKMN